MFIRSRAEKPLAAVVVNAADAVRVTGTHRLVEAKDAYSEKLLELGVGGKACAAEYTINIAKTGEYHIRAACDSGQVLQGFDLAIDGHRAPRESAPYLDLTRGITRRPYSTHNLWWIPGWQVALAAGTHKLLFTRPESGGAAALILDAIAVQPTLDMSLAK